MTTTSPTPAATEEAQQPVEKPPLIGKKEKRAIKDPLWVNNPISLQALGVCSALAVTVKLQPTLIMCLAVIFVLSFSNLIISALRNYIPNKIRIIVMLVVISSLVTIADTVLKAFAFTLAKEITVFISLIVTNCIVMGRAEAYAMGNTPFRSMLDGFGNALGYSWILVAVAFFRELLGAGTLFDVRIFAAGDTYVHNGLMVLAPGAFLLLGIIIWVQRAISGYKEEN